jgi:hypothetical protein
MILREVVGKRGGGNEVDFVLVEPLGCFLGDLLLLLREALL